MSARRRTVVLISLALMGSGCARLFPSSKQDDQPSRLTRPRVEKTATRRRDGSDVTLPSESSTNWPARLLLDCDRADSAATGPRATNKCQHIDERVDTLRAPVDTARKQRP